MKDQKLVEKLKNDQTPLTVCPLSNVKLCVFNNLNQHNLKKMLDEKLMVMINSDDPAYFGGYINDNLIESQIALVLSMDEIRTLIIISFKPSPRETATNICGNIPMTDPKKKFFILTLKIVGKIFEIKKGIPPTNL